MLGLALLLAPKESGVRFPSSPPIFVTNSWAYSSTAESAADYRLIGVQFPVRLPRFMTPLRLRILALILDLPNNLEYCHCDIARNLWLEDHRNMYQGL